MSRNKCQCAEKEVRTFVRHLVNSFLTKGLNQFSSVLVHSEINKI